MSIRKRLAEILAKAARRGKDANLTEVRLRPMAKMKIRVYRAATGKWETVKEA